MKKVLLSAIVFLTSVMIASAQVNAPKETPQLEFALQLQVTLGETYLLRAPSLMVALITSWQTRH